jgi:hypothetical protein
VVCGDLRTGCSTEIGLSVAAGEYSRFYFMHPGN